MFNWYKWLWSRIGGRPWTYIIRDFYHDAPLPFLLVVLATGGAIGHYTGFVTFMKILGILLIGMILGHLFWGTKWIPNQPGNGNSQNIEKVNHDKKG